MAIKLKDEYPGQYSEADPTGYPDGAPRNDLTEDDGTGTPLDQRWFRDWEGFKQMLLNEASIEANGTPDKVGASQIYDAAMVIFMDRFAQAITNDNISNALIALTSRMDTAEADIDAAEDELDTIDSGEFTGSAITNLSGISAVNASTDSILWQRVGDVISASAFFSVTNSASGAKSFEFTLPGKTGSFSGTGAAIGAGAVFPVAAVQEGVNVSSVDGSTKALVEWNSTRSSGSESLRVSFHYRAGA